MLDIRRERDADRHDVFAIHQDAFQRDDEAQLVNKLRQNEQFNPSLSFVALVHNKPVGHLLFTPLQINYPSTGKSIASLALAPLSVLTEYQKQGIGSKLVQHALTELKAQGYPSVVVLGHEHYYPKFGFVPAKQFRVRASFPLENEDCFMTLELQPQAFPLDDGEGTVQYLPEFGI